MDIFVKLRIFILITGWFFLIGGSVFILYKQFAFNKKIGQPVLSKMILFILTGWFLTMYSLGITSTMLMYNAVILGVKIVLPLFIVWLITMIILFTITNRWNKEIAFKQDFYEQLESGIRKIVYGDFSYKINLKDKRENETSVNAKLFNQMVQELQKREEAFMETSRREKELNRMKSDFISIAAHQLRTPLSAIKWVFSILLSEDDNKLTEEQRETLKKGEDSTEKMIVLVNDLLNVSRIEEGKFAYEFKTISLHDIIKKVILMEEGEIKEKEINLSFEKENGGDFMIEADSEKLFVAFQNIIENAVNYTLKKGLIKIILQETKFDFTVKIEDNGVGVPKKQMNKIFDKFVRGENVIKMQTEGTGLGLFITKNIIEKHSGKITIESEESKGTTVIISLPKKQIKK